MLRLGPRAPDTATSRGGARRGFPLTIIDLPENELRDLYESDLALIRPDQIVAWRGNRVPDDPAALLAQVTGS